jgi:hypothetical protein
MSANERKWKIEFAFHSRSLASNRGFFFMPFVDRNRLRRYLRVASGLARL